MLKATNNRMKLSINKSIKIAKEAAMLAGKSLLNKKKDFHKVILSTDKDIKLQADLKAEEIIKDFLTSNSNIEILAEESGLSSDSLPEFFWVGDPLDGTANYARDIPICCVSIALVTRLKPILGVIYDFNNDDLYEGSIETKSLCNEKEIKVSNIASSSEGILITGLPNDTDYSDDALQKMIKDFQSWRKIRMMGSAAMASAYIASGKAEVYSEKKTYLWDVAAGAAIVNAAGGKAIISNQNNKFQVDVLFTNSSIEI
jgi:myo-inositol-1(or 4)-monophosphatase